MTLEEYINRALTVHREILDEQGNGTLISTNLDTYTEDSRFYIFNYNNGQHEFFDNLIDAGKYWNELKQQLTKEYHMEYSTETALPQSTIDNSRPPTIHLKI